jgi:hypothetical protein
MKISYKSYITFIDCFITGEAGNTNIFSVARKEKNIKNRIEELKEAYETLKDIIIDLERGQND